jgi:phenylpyruvate C(3)-methyltransferase
MATRTMQALFNIGFVDELLDKIWADANEFARKHDLDPHILNSLCESFYCLSLFKKRGGNEYALDEQGLLLVETLRGWFEVSYGYEEIFQRLEEQLRKQIVYERDFYRRSDFVAKGSGEMENWLFFPLMNELIRKNGYKRVMDLGCGDGTFLRKLCATNEQISGLGIDLAPSAITDGKRRAVEAGLSHRIDLWAADISSIEELPAPFKSVDVATVFFVLHELLYTSEQRVVDFLQAFRKLFPGVPLIVFEAIRPTAEALRKKPGISIYYFLYHDLSHQKPVDRDQWKRIFRIAGFTNINERYLGFTRSAIYILS